MKILELPTGKLKQAPWNPNQLDNAGITRLVESLNRYGLVEPLVVRPKDNAYEVLSGNQRIKALSEIGFDPIPCVVVDLNDAESMLLAQALNNLHGEDDQVMKGNLIKTVLCSIPEDKVLSLLPETAESLKSITQFNQEDLAQHLQAWQEAQAARLKHMIVQLTDNQHDLVQDAIKRIMPNVKEDDSGSPNNRGTAIFLLCKFYLDHEEQE
jgi:ParB family transcriptional regulator, chromosome partitioning protein